MELDKRIINDCKIYSCFDAGKAKEYVNSEGYFSNDISDFSNLCTCYRGTLKGVYKENPKSYLNEELDMYFHFFLPERFVKKEEKKYIPFKYLNELTDKGIKVGVTIKIKNKNYPEMEQLVVVSEINYNSKDKELIDITLGATGYEFETLLESYLYQTYSGHEFKPFGVGVEE